MRWVWSGVLMAGLLLILWDVFDSRESTTPDATRYYGEDGTPLPPPYPPGPPDRS